MTGQAVSRAQGQVLVSYVTVVRNNAMALPRAIESVQRQTYPHVEHVILDGASTDGTLDVLVQHADRIDYFASEPDEGLYDALNKAIPLARGDLVCVLNSDDWLEPDAAKSAVARLGDLELPTMVLTAAAARCKSPRSDSPMWVLDWQPAPVHPGCYFMCANDCHNGIYASRSVYEQSGPYDHSYEIAGDFKWIMSCLETGVRFRYAANVTVNYLLGGVSGNAKRHGLECVRVMRERFPSLTYEEAGGLHHSFFVFPPDPSIPGRPDDRHEFLHRLLTGHADDDELLAAVAWALLMRPDQRGQAATAGALIKELVVLALRGHPTLFHAAERLYAAARGK